MLAFIHIRKTAGSTIDMILRQSFGMRHCRVRHGRRRAGRPVIAAREVRRCRWVYWGLECVSGHGIVPYSDLPALDNGMQYFTWLREPLTRCASDYQFRVVRGGLQQPFDEWINTDVARNQQTKKLAGTEDAAAAIEILEKRVGFVGLVERFDESLVMLRRWYQPRHLDIRYASKNVASDSSHKRRLLSQPATREKLADANREDLKLYQYVLEHTSPKQIRDYGAALQADVSEFVASNNPLPVLPRQLPSMLLREAVYKPLAPLLRDKSNSAFNENAA
jgi:hypothetical protein